MKVVPKRIRFKAYKEALEIWENPTEREKGLIFGKRLCLLLPKLAKVKFFRYLDTPFKFPEFAEKWKKYPLDNSEDSINIFKDAPIRIKILKEILEDENNAKRNRAAARTAKADGI